MVSHNAELPFSEHEFKARVARVRAGMVERALDALIVTTPENIYYLTGYSTPGYYATQALVLPRDEEPFLFTTVVEVDNARLWSTVRQVDWYGPTDQDQPMSLLADALRRRGLAASRLGVEMRGWFFPIALYRELAAALTSAQLVDGGGLVEACRAVKSDAEIAYIREGARIASLSMRAVMEAIKPGATENDLAATAYASSIRAGGEYPGSPPFVASGPRVCRPHASWHRREIRPGDQVFVELSGCVGRYSGALMRTFSLGGSVSDELQRLEEAILRGLQAAIAALRPGARSRDVDAACRSAVKNAGFSYSHRTGYSIGVCYPPGWNEGNVLSLRPGDERVVQPNMTFHLVPHVILPGVGAVGISETVLVTERGSEVLTDFPRALIRI